MSIRSGYAGRSNLIFVQAPRTPGWARPVARLERPFFVKTVNSCDEVAEAGGGAVVIAPVKVVSLIAPFPVLGTLTRKIFSSVAEVLTGNSSEAIWMAAVK